MGEVRRRREEHLNRHGAKASQKKKFEEEYGKKKGDYVYGATVGKVKREREEKHEGKKGGDPPLMGEMPKAFTELMGFEKRETRRASDLKRELGL